MHKNKLLYLFFSFLSGFLELGSVISVITNTNEITVALFTVLAYQLATVIDECFRFPRWAVMASAALAFGSFYSNLPTLFIFGVFLSGIAIQALRRLFKSSIDVGTATKRAFRVIGFCCAGFASHYNLALLSVCIFILALFPTKYHSIQRILFLKPNLKVSTTAVTMVFHQVHYFSYAYVLVGVFILHWKLSPVQTALTFITGWLSYILSKTCFGERRPFTVVILGHILVAASLTCIFLKGFYSLNLTVSLWILTGFGGGTVYCIRLLDKMLPIESQVDLDFWENVGHIAGVILSIAVIYTANSFKLPFMVGAAFAILTVFCILSISRKLLRDSSLFC